MSSMRSFLSNVPTKALCVFFFSSISDTFPIYAAVFQLISSPNIFSPDTTKRPLWTSRSPLSAVAEVKPTSEVGTPMRCGYVVLLRCMVIYGYGVLAEDLKISCTVLPRPWSPWGPSPSRKNPHSRTGNRTRNLIISSQ
jgi:hypothetical protein